jgi:hypothetical protein
VQHDETVERAVSAEEEDKAMGTGAPSPSGAGMLVTPSLASPPCPNCGSSDASELASYVYAIGRVEPRFPSVAVEKEFTQATGRAETTGLSDRAALQKVLTERANRYLARQLCWVFTVEGLETYLLRACLVNHAVLLASRCRSKRMNVTSTSVSLVCTFRS